MTEDQPVAVEAPGVSTPEGNPLMDQSLLGKAPGLQTPECLLFLLQHVCLSSLSIVSSMV